MEDSHATQPYKHTDDDDFSHEIQKEENEEAEQGPFSVPCNQYFEAISDIIHGLHNTLCEGDEALNSMMEEMTDLVDGRKREAEETQKWLAKVARIPEGLPPASGEGMVT